MADIEEVRVELQKLEKDSLIELITSGKLPDNFENYTVQSYLEEKSLLKSEDKTITDNREADSDSMLKTFEVADPSKEDFYWRNYVHKNIPVDAVDIADGKYIGQVNFEENVLPVVIYPDENAAYGERAGKQVFYQNVKILCASNSKKFYWEHVDFNKPTAFTMKNAVTGGFQDGYDLYIGKGSDPYYTDTKIGKVVPMTNTAWKGLQVWGSYDECVVISKFHILKCGLPTIVYEDPVLMGFHWRDYVPCKLPSDAIEACDGKYIGQISRYGDIPVSIDPTENIVFTERDGRKSAIKENIKILCSSEPHKFVWEPVEIKEDIVVRKAVVGGYKDGFHLFIGRTFREGEWKVGKVVLSDSTSLLGLNIWDKDDKLIVVDKFELLKYDAEKVLNG